MSDSPDEIRAEIERTRQALGADVDAAADKVTPSKVMHRQGTKMKRAMSSMTERVMGAAESGRSGGGEVADNVTEMAHQTKAKVEGNPLAVGLIAFGAGLLAASLIPVSEKEKNLSAAVKEETQPLMKEASDAAKEVASNLKEPAQEAVQTTKERASQAVDEVKEEGSDAAGSVKDRAGEARENISDSCAAPAR